MDDTTELLPCVELATAPEPTHSIVWLHGLGADGNDFAGIVPELGLQDLAIRFVFPHAPSIPVTINGGMVMPAWYDILEMDLRRRHDEGGVRRSARQVEALVAREVERGVPRARILLAGFSQGGAIATHCALRSSERFAGLVALSTYLVCEDSVERELDESARGLEVFHAHGTHDPMVAVARGRAARERLEELGLRVEAHEYPMMHQVCLEEIRDLSRWLRQRVEAS